MRKITVQNSLIISEAVKLISEGREVTLRAKGRSMLPFVKDGDVVQLVKPQVLQLYDIVLAQVAEGQYVLHRIVDICDDRVVLMGDGNLRECEQCGVNSVLAVAVKIIRGDKEYDCRDSSHLRLSKIWRWLLPIRRYLLAIYRVVGL